MENNGNKKKKTKPLVHDRKSVKPTVLTFPGGIEPSTSA